MKLKPVKFQYKPEIHNDMNSIYIEWFGTGWGIRKEPNMNFVFNRLGEWEYQPMPSSRTEDFYKRCRYETVDEAVANLEKYGL